MDSKEPKKKRRLGINLIENRDELHATFTKRRQGLFKKATEFCDNFAAQAVVITFSSSGDVYALGDPRFDPLLKRYLADPSSVAASNNGVNGGGIMVATLTETETETETEKRIREALGKGRSAWDAETVNLGFSELDDMETAIRKMKSKVNDKRSRRTMKAGYTYMLDLSSSDSELSRTKHQGSSVTTLFPIIVNIQSLNV